MIMTIFILLITAVIAFVYIPKLKKSNETKTIVIFSIFLMLGAALNIAVSLRFKIPSPIDLITFIFSPIKDLFVSLTK
ncbi:hypothetical protein LAV73_05995 [Lysinibacillus xylanilyticus]|uniref:hypothetical protein n=1 Tax=Lysinibacillus xylanilyticus TaxID=582475 RepID=UPI002B24D48D|nr:hypothetical protein [Lysinibacillus xylanilyticus]MEB2279555.1 hypothetical protein [Lysinibacillus xylanilyticus]